MNCPYCQQPCDKDPKEYDHVSSTVWMCKQHPVLVGFAQEPEDTAPRAISLLVYHNDNKYRVELYWLHYFKMPPGDATYFDIYSVDEEDNNKLVVSTINRPSNLTPENVTQKLPIWLTFQ